jgi:hypothetical protein
MFRTPFGHTIDGTARALSQLTPANQPVKNMIMIWRISSLIIDGLAISYEPCVFNLFFYIEGIRPYSC